MIIGLANSIRFYIDNSDPVNFDNRSYQDSRNFNFNHSDYCQKYYSDDDVVIQIKVPDGEDNPTVTVYKEDLTTATITPAIESSYENYDIWEFTVDMSLYTVPFRIVVKNNASTYRSEVIEVVDESTELLLIQWKNRDNAFEIDYSTGITHVIRIEGILTLSSPGGEQSIYDNLEEMIKLREEVKRVMKLSVKEIPDQLVEKLRIAVAHDLLFVNEIQYTAEGLPEYSPGELTNLYEFTIDLTQTSVLGLNTHDIGLDEDDEFEEVDPVAMQAIGERIYTEQNFVTDEETITSSIDELDQAVAGKADTVHRHDDLYEPEGAAAAAVGDHETNYNHDAIGTALQDIIAGVNVSIDKDDPIRPVIHCTLAGDGNADIQITGLRLIAENWTFDDPLWIYELTVAPLGENYTFEVIPARESEATIKAAGIFTECDGEDGKIIIYAESQPGANIDVTVNIRVSADLSTYITEETDPVFTASAAAGITSDDITNWDGKWNTPGTGARSSSTDAGYFRETSIDDDFLYICVFGGEVGYAKWKKIVLLET